MAEGLTAKGREQMPRIIRKRLDIAVLRFIFPIPVSYNDILILYVTFIP